MLRICAFVAAILVLPAAWAVAQPISRPTAWQQAAIKAICRSGISVNVGSERPYIHVRQEREYKRLTEQEAALLETFPQICTLKIEGEEPIDEWLAHAQRMPGLKELKINLSSPTARFTSRQLDAVLKLAQLEEVELWDGGLSDSDIGKFAALKNLRDLRLGWQGLTPGVFAELAKVSGLRKLLIFGNYGPAAPVPNWSELAKLQHLESLTLTRIELQPAQCRGVELLPSLQTLAIEVTQFDDEVLDALKRMPKLDRLQLICPRVTGRGLAGLRESKSLKTVWISCRGDLRASDMAFLLEYSDPKNRAHSFNTSLSLSEFFDTLPAPIKGLVIQGRDRFSSSHKMTVFANRRSIGTERNLTDDDMQAVARLRDLESLSLTTHPVTKDAVAVTHEGLQKLEGLPKLRRLTLGLRKPLDGPSLAVLGTFPSLDQLVLHDVAIDANGLQWLSSAKALRSLEIVGGQIHGDALASIGAAPSLMSLTLKNVRLEPPRFESLGGALLTGLNLEKCDVTDADCIAIGECKSIRILRIDGATLTDAGLAQFASLQDLESLQLNTSGEITLKALRSLEPLARLQYIDAVGQGKNRLMDEGMSEEFGWTFQGECSCGCMDFTRPPAHVVTKDEIRDGAVVLGSKQAGLNNPSGLRFRGPMKLERLTLRAEDFSFPVRELHFNDCQIEELVLVGIAPNRIAHWGDTKIQSVSRQEPPAKPK